MKKDAITLERLRELFSFDPETGVFTWVNPTNWSISRGEALGRVGAHGYVCAILDGKSYLVHRLAWLWMTGEWPKNSIDHINGIKTDNRFCNLRDVTHSMNCHNKRIRNPTNKHGAMGVCWMEKRKTWVANICVNKRNKNLGDFETKEAAAQAYLEAKMKLHPGVAL